MAEYSIAKLMVTLGINDAGLKTGVTGANSALQSLGKQAAATALGFIGANSIAQAMSKAASIAIGAISDFMALEKAMYQIGDIANLNREQINNLIPEVHALAQTYAIDQGSLAVAMKSALKSGIEFTDIMPYMANAIRLSKISGEDLVITTDAMTKTMRAFKIPTVEAADVANTLFISLKNGRVSLAEMEGMLGKIAPMAGEVGISFKELSSMFSALTSAGMDTSEAGMSIRMILNSLRDPAKEVSDFAKTLGIEFSISAVKAKGFSNWMAEVGKATGGSAEALSILFPGLRQAGTSILFTTDVQKKYNDVLLETKTNVNALTDAEDKRAMSLNKQWKRAAADMGEAADTLGLTFGPVLAFMLMTWNQFTSDFVEGSKGISRWMTRLISVFNIFGTAYADTNNQREKGLKVSEAEAQAIYKKILYGQQLTELEQKQFELLKKGWAEKGKIADGENKYIIEKVTNGQKLTEQEQKQFEILKQNDQYKKVALEAEVAAEKNFILNKISNGQKLTEQEKKQVAEMKVNAKDRERIAAAEANWSAKKFKASKENAANEKDFNRDSLAIKKEILKADEENAMRSAELQKKATETRFALLEAQKNNEIEMLDAVANDEKLTFEKRMAAAVELQQKKIELIEIERQKTLAAAGENLIIESTKYMKIFDNIKAMKEQLDKVYLDSSGKVIAAKETEYLSQKANLDKIEKDTEETLGNVGEQYAKTSDQINQEFNTKVQKETTALFKLKYEVEGGTFEKLFANVKKNYDTWINDLEQGSTQAWSGLVSDSADAIKGIARLFGDLPRDLEPVLNDLTNIISSALSGNPIQMAVALLSGIGRAIYGAGENSKFAAEKEEEAAKQAKAAANAFLKSQGMAEVSEMSISELTDYMAEIVSKTTEAYPEGFAVVEGKAAGIEQYYAAEQAGIKLPALTGQKLSLYQAYKRARKARETGLGGAGTNPVTARGWISKYPNDPIKLLTILKGNSPITNQPYWYELDPQTWEQIQGDAAAMAAPPLSLAGYAAASAPIITYGGPLGANVAPTAANNQWQTTTYKTAVEKEAYLDNWKSQVESRFAGGQITAQEYASEMATIAAEYDKIAKDAGTPYAKKLQLFQKASECSTAATNILEEPDITGGVTGGRAAGGRTASYTIAENPVDARINNSMEYIDNWIDRVNNQYALGDITGSQYQKEIMKIVNTLNKWAREPGISLIKNLILRKKAKDLLAASADVWQGEYGAAHYGEAGATGGPAAISNAPNIPSPLGEQLGIHLLPGAAIGTGDTGQAFINTIDALLNNITGGVKQLLPDNMNINVTVSSDGQITDGQANAIAITIGDAIGTSMSAQGETP